MSGCSLPLSFVPEGEGASSSTSAGSSTGFEVMSGPEGELEAMLTKYLRWLFPGRLRCER